MSRLRIFYILSLLLLGVLLVFTVFRPMVSGGEYSEVKRKSLLRSENGWVIQYDLINQEGKEQNYTIYFSVDDDKPYQEDVLLQDGKIFTFIGRISPHELSGGEGEVNVTIYKEGETAPFEDAVYYLK